MFVENGHNQIILYSIIRENKHQSAKSKNTNSNIVKLPWIPIIGPKIIRKEFRKTGYRVIFTSAAKLKNILCKNRSKLLPNSYPVVYELSSGCVCVCLCVCVWGGYWRNKKTRARSINWTPRRQHCRKMGSVGCNWIFQRMSWAVQLAAPKNTCKIVQHTRT